jgi:Leucine-rich repeat (LRR) protein
MNLLNNYQISDFAIRFPPSSDPAVLSLKQKCEQLDLIEVSNDSRKVFDLETPHSPKVHDQTVTEIELRNWINNLGESTVFAGEDEFENWERLLFSDAPENKILALTLLNTRLRPEAKFFSLWLALGSLSSDEGVRETAEMMVLQYLTTAEWQLFEASKISATITRFVKQNQELPHFIDTNYLQIWSELLLTNSPFFTQKWLRLTNNGLEKILEYPILLDKLPEITQFNYRITDKESPLFLDFFQKHCPNIKYLQVFSDAPRHFSSEEFGGLNSENLIVKNCYYPAAEKPMPKLSKVNKLEWIYPDKVNFYDDLFPKLTSLDVLGTMIERFEIDQIRLNLENLVYSFSEQNTLPPVTYDCVNLKEIHPHDLTNFEFPPEVKKLKKLETICFGESTLKRFPVEIGLFSKLRYAWGVDLKEVANFQNHSFKGPMDITLMHKKMKEFPYYLGVIQKLKTLGLMFNEISTIDERILQFSKLESLTIGQNKFTEIPDVLRQLPKLKYLYLSNNQITNVSFDWVLLANQKRLQLNLQDNPIDDLPLIPFGIDLNKIEKNKGKISLRKNQIPQKRITEYTKIFGPKFLSIY